MAKNGTLSEGSGLVLLQDSMLSLVASLLSILAVRWLSSPIAGFSALVLTYLGASLVSMLLGELASGSYKVVRRWASFRSSSRLLGAVTVKEVLLSLVLVAGLVRLPSLALSVLSILLDGLFTAFLLFYIRFASRLFSKEEVRRVKVEASRMNALVYGTGKDAVALTERIRKENRYNVIGYLTEDPAREGQVIGDAVVYHCAGRAELEALEWRLGGVDCVFFPKTVHPGAETMAGGPPVPDGMSRAGHSVKRSFDVFLSGLLVIAFAPLGALCALAVKLEDGGPVLYRQERIGKDGKPFHILKFRSMREDAEEGGARLYGGEDDPRLTKVGAFLRAHHLDELPQLWNVLRGDMSFIGYRPERACFIREIMAKNPRYRYLYQIRPGVTSYATLYNGYTDTLEKMLTRLDLDLYYLRHHSLWFDARVLGLTFLGIVSGKRF